MSKLIECLNCHDSFKKEDMHVDGHQHTQTCKGCYKEIKAKNAMETKRHRNATLQARIENQEIERNAKHKALGDAIMNGSKETPILIRLSKSEEAERLRVCRGKLSDIAMAKELGISVADFTGDEL